MKKTKTSTRALRIAIDKIDALPAGASSAEIGAADAVLAAAYIVVGNMLSERSSEARYVERMRALRAIPAAVKAQRAKAKEILPQLSARQRLVLYRLADTNTTRATSKTLMPLLGLGLVTSKHLRSVNLSLWIDHAITPLGLAVADIMPVPAFWTPITPKPSTRWVETGIRRIKGDYENRLR